MTYFIRKIYLATALLSVPFVGNAYGDYGIWSRWSGNGKEYAFSSNPEYDEYFDSYLEQSCAVEPCSECCCGTRFLTTDLLFWRGFEGGLDDCVPTLVSDTVDGSIVTSTFRGRGQEPHFKWAPGIRVGIGYDSGDEWDYGAYYTYFHSQSKGPTVNNYLWNINFDLLDVVAGYESDLSCSFALRPFAGLRGASINQKLRISDFSAEATSIMDNDQKFFGIGPLLGLEANWDIGCGFRLFASGSLSWLYGNFDVTLKESGTTVDTVTSCNVTKHLDASVNSVDAAIGVRWYQ
ncbi:MAG: Lpg1974 family pore-forming outer membrane protein [Chlamydiales bacterium]|nr:Lpg1974 family pore-forming outer membrane protein [Chlamydiales bacterium]